MAFNHWGHISGETDLIFEQVTMQTYCKTRGTSSSLNHIPWLSCNIMDLKLYGKSGNTEASNGWL